MPTIAAEKALEKLKEDMAKELEPNEFEELLVLAKKRVESIEKKSTIFSEAAENNILRFDINELELGKQLGVGGFARVSAIAAINIDMEENTKPPLHSREYMSMQCIRTVGGPRYAIKQLSRETRSERNRFEKGIADIVVEARILAVIQHENIIRIRGYATGDYFDKDFFIVMDRLQITLDQQIINWYNELNRPCSFCCSSQNKIDADNIRDDQLATSVSIASAVEFLHSKNIIYRDLKPENIGFDVRDNVKLFDFGLVAEVNPSKANEDGTYKLTGFTGSPVYMAPEVANHLPYNFKADSYSFGILFWTIMALRRPYEKLTFNALQEFVMNGTYRPKLEDDWSDTVKKLMEDCWSRYHATRPTFEEISVRLQNEGFGASSGNVLDASTTSYSKIMAQLGGGIRK